MKIRMKTILCCIAIFVLILIVICTGNFRLHRTQSNKAEASPTPTIDAATALVGGGGDCQYAIHCKVLEVRKNNVILAKLTDVDGTKKYKNGEIVLIHYEDSVVISSDKKVSLNKNEKPEVGDHLWGVFHTDIIEMKGNHKYLDLQDFNKIR